MFRRTVLLTLTWLLSLCFGSWSETARKTVFVSVLPQSFFVEKIGGKYVRVEVFVGPGASPATYEPTPKQMVSLSGASLFFRTGVPFENGFIHRLGSSHADLKIVDLRKGIEMRAFGEEETHHHGDHSEEAFHHGEERKDPHIWLSPRLASQQCGTICDALCGLMPGQEAFFRNNLNEMRRTFDELDQELSRLLAPFEGSSFFVFHPAYGYFADAYGLKQVSVEHEGKQPSAKQLVELIQLAKDNNVKVLFVQPQFSKRAAQAVADAIGGTVLTLDPLAKDVMNNLRTMGSRIADALSGGQAP